ncbi:ribose 5-phosphate isomerase B [Candidatus Aerophobetes bacterium]|nr:ribose 5-phosphate isomerase B [Candidatus Aerophobetes bacterium]
MKENKNFSSEKNFDFAIGSDHAGFYLKEKIKEYLTKIGKKVLDVGTYTPESTDSGPIAEKVGQLVVEGKCGKGILICGTGIGMSMGANKVFGVRAALCHNIYTARYAKMHNDANILCLGARVIGDELALECVKAWMEEKFLGGKYARRMNYLDVIEEHSFQKMKEKGK